MSNDPIKMRKRKIYKRIDTHWSFPMGKTLWLPPRSDRTPMNAPLIMPSPVAGVKKMLSCTSVRIWVPRMLRLPSATEIPAPTVIFDYGLFFNPKSYLSKFIILNSNWSYNSIFSFFPSCYTFINIVKLEKARDICLKRSNRLTEVTEPIIKKKINKVPEKYSK